jgi:hypothetical protein
MEPTKFYKLRAKWTLYKSQSSWDTILSTIYSQLVGVSSCDWWTIILTGSTTNIYLFFKKIDDKNTHAHTILILYKLRIEPTSFRDGIKERGYTTRPNA